MKMGPEPRKPPPGRKKPTGFCECGCGQRTSIALTANIRRDQYAGYALRYVQGHSLRTCSKGSAHQSWKGGRWKHKSGYIYIYVPEHPHSNRDGHILEHRVVYERYHKIRLTKKDIIHHVNGKRDDNRPENLMKTDLGKHAKMHNALAAWKRAHPRLAKKQSSKAGKKGAIARWGRHHKK